ncbi:MAG: AAA family ATPase [Moraxellaceae bacterium]|nr:AAA family ATPase [Moraxellaceae bacterium]
MRLKVQNFVCLQDVDVELNDITFFIGEQASGKSLLCKLYFYFRRVVPNIFEQLAFNSSDSLYDYKSMCIKEFLILFPKKLWNNEQFSIFFGYDNFELYIKAQHGEIVDVYLLDKEFLDAKKIFNQKIDQISNVEDLNYIKLRDESVLELKINGIFDDTLYIPSGRTFFSSISDNIFLLLANKISIDPFLSEFGRYYEVARVFYEEKLLGVDVTSLCESILKGRIQFDDKKRALIKQSHFETPINYASSGQQEALPLLLVLTYLISGKTLDTHSVVIEEPETHLFPTAQKAIVDLLFLIKQQSQTKHFLVTTHSPYILSCANNALLRNPDIKVNAYYLANGTAKRIMDDEVGLIDGIDLDGVSYKIAEEFDELLAKSDNHG